jgi:membrane protein implicated in regulation of membrane protease activity
MSYADFYLTCFIVGLALSVLSFVMGGLRWHIPHLPHAVGHGHLGGPVHAGHVLHTGRAAAGPQISPFNFMTLTAFLTWFGGMGFLLSRYSSLWFLAGVLFATAVGVVGAAIIFVFMTKVLLSKDEAMDPADYEMVGVLGRICSPIREGGTGEILYSQAGTRRVCGARSDGGAAIAKGTEVVVTRYERGIAYVQPWEQLAGDEAAAAGPGGHTAR